MSGPTDPSLGHMPQFEVPVLKQMAEMLAARIRDGTNMNPEAQGIIKLLRYPSENPMPIAVFGWISNYVAKAEKGTASGNSADNDLPDTMEEDDKDSEELLAESAVVPYPENAP